MNDTQIRNCVYATRRPRSRFVWTPSSVAAFVFAVVWRAVMLVVIGWFVFEAVRRFLGK